MYIHQRMSTPSSPASAIPCACTALRKAARSVARLYDEALKPAGMTAGQLAILRTIARAGEAPLSDLARAMVMDRTSLYRAVAPLMARGWVTVAAGRGRAKQACLTAAGEAAAEAAAPGWEAAQARFITAFGVEPTLELHAMLASVAAVAQDLS